MAKYETVGMTHPDTDGVSQVARKNIPAMLKKGYEMADGSTPGPKAAPESAVDPDDVDKDGESDSEKDAIRARLTELGVGFHPFTGLEKLQARLVEAEAEADESEGES